MFDASSTCGIVKVVTEEDVELNNEIIVMESTEGQIKFKLEEVEVNLAEIHRERLY